MSEIKKLRDAINKARENNQETLLQIREDAATEYDEIEKKNASNLAQVQDMGLKAKAEIQAHSKEAPDSKLDNPNSWKLCDCSFHGKSLRSEQA